jgi:uncharacterized protein YbaR (Trm112 family)/2-polyprenyl-3-methyl-5-hydroxy-6-metoxy-1,4-benzoquinol methylase
MRPRLSEILVCPIDGTRLELLEWETRSVSLTTEEVARARHLGIDPALLSREIITGVLVNRNRKIFYPIHDGVPRMLVFRTGVADQFRVKHAQRIGRELAGFSMPHEKPMPGEETVLRTFSSEWVNYDWDERSYWNLSPETLYQSMNFMLDLNHRPVKNKLVLEVGIGIGGIANYMASREQCELVGVDLSYAVDPAYKHFGNNPYLHIVQASAFAPPFREETFDLVYSQGVLMATFSTKTAVARISKLPKIGGRLYVWVYNPRSDQRTFSRRAIMLLENVLRPICWRLPESLQAIVLAPLLPLYLAHQNLHTKHTGYGYVNYSWREAMHAARDRFTPRYAHRHTEAEVCDWFRELGYGDLQCLNNKKQPDFLPLALYLDTAVDGVRQVSHDRSPTCVG